MKYLSTRRLPLWHLFLSLCVGMLLLSFSSCGDSEVEEAQKRAEYARIIDERSSKDLLNELYIASGGDTEALARVLQVTPSSIERLRKGETSPTDAFQARLKEVSTYYAQHDKSFRELRIALDSEYAWYNRIWSWPFAHGWVLLAIFLGNMVLGFLFGEDAFAPIGFAILFAIALWLFSGLLTLFFSPDKLNDPYTQSVNPIIEVLVDDAD